MLVGAVYGMVCIWNGMCVHACVWVGVCAYMHVRAYVGVSLACSDEQLLVQISCIVEQFQVNGMLSALRPCWEQLLSVALSVPVLWRVTGDTWGVHASLGHVVSSWGGGGVVSSWGGGW